MIYCFAPVVYIDVFIAHVGICVLGTEKDDYLYLLGMCANSNFPVRTYYYRGKDNTGVTDRVVNQLLTFIDGAECIGG